MKYNDDYYQQRLYDPNDIPELSRASDADEYYYCARIWDRALSHDVVLYWRKGQHFYRFIKIMRGGDGSETIEMKEKMALKLDEEISERIYTRLKHAIDSREVVRLDSEDYFRISHVDTIYSIGSNGVIKTIKIKGVTTEHYKDGYAKVFSGRMGFEAHIPLGIWIVSRLHTGIGWFIDVVFLDPLFEVISWGYKAWRKVFSKQK